MKKVILSFLVLLSTMLLYSQNDYRTQIDALFQSWDNRNNPGAALAVVKDGQIIYSAGYGSAHLEHGIPINPSSVFYIGSVSKQFVTFCILLLEEEGKLSLDDPIQKYFPDFPDYGSQLTIRHFIHHTSGVRDYLTLMDLKGRSYLDHIDEEEVYELIRSQKELNFIPGDQYLYSNSCYFMLALIVHKASGQTLRQYAEENIFKPLGMKHTLFYDNVSEMIMNKAVSYQKTKLGFDNQTLRFDLVGSGGVYSTVEDLFRWDQNFYHNKLGKGGEGIIDKMHVDGILNNGKSAGYAFALVNDNYRGLRTVGHGGALAGYRAELLRFPDQHFSVILLANRSDANPARKAQQIADIVLEEDFAKVNELIPESDLQKEEEFIPLEDTDLHMFTGDYKLRAGMNISVKLANDSLEVTEHWSKNSYKLYPFDNQFFKMAGDDYLLFAFQGKEEANATEFIIKEGNQLYRASRTVFPDLSAVNYSEYPAKYYCPELDYSYVIKYEDGKLKVKTGEPGFSEMDGTDEDEFISGGLLFSFERKEGKISGFRLGAGRVQNLVFTRSN